MKLKYLIACALFALCYGSKAQQKIYPNLKAGDIAPDAVNVDAEEIKFLINGACVIHKGNQTAIIDLKGNFLCPWSNNQFELMTSNLLFAPLIPIRDPATGSMGYINTQGKIVIPFDYITTRFFDYHGTAIVEKKTGGPFSIDAKGNRLPVLVGAPSNPIYDREVFGQRQSRYVRFTANGKYGYKLLTGTVAFPAQFDGASEFTDGMASVMKIDQFGVQKWGYINASFRLVIPYTYQIQPGNFHDGLALVAPFTHTTFNYAYIDKTGTIKFTIGDGSRSGIVPVGPTIASAGNFVNGYALWRKNSEEKQLLDTLGRFHNVGDIIKHPELAANKDAFVLNDINDMGIVFSTANTNNRLGIMDFQGNVLFPPVFWEIRPDYYSHYAIARRLSNPKAQGLDAYTTGIVNQQGVFVLILKKPSTF